MTWDMYLTDQDRAVIELGGYGARGALGDKIALLIVDVTYGFCGDRPEPLLDSVQRYRNSSGERAWEAVGVIQGLLDAARREGHPIIYTRGLGPTERVSKGKWASKNRRASEDTDHHQEIVASIAPRDEEVVLAKAKPSGFFGTPLASLLVELGVDSLIVCGGTTSGCVRATVVDAFSYNYAVSVVREATFDRVEASHWVSLLDMDMKYADVISEKDALSSLAAVTVGRPQFR